ncbi:MAG: hypothetical protein HFJ28_06225 [Clostridia bacterium]|nr:hypothetical protein [Clostridia bacterium]
MNKAQEIRQKRLNERKEIAEKKTKHDLEIKAKAEELFNWVLDMLDTPTANNTADEVHLSDSYYNKIRVGYNYEKGLTDKPFECEVMKQLAKMFKAEDGYTGKYFSGTFPDSHSSVTIKIK